MNRGLVQRRKEVGWFAGKQGIQYDQLKEDLGAKPSARYGLTGRILVHHASCFGSVNHPKLRVKSLSTKRGLSWVY